MFRICLIVIFILLVAVSSLFAVAKTFNPAGLDKDWTNPSNWDPPGVPTVHDSVYIPSEVPYCRLPNNRVVYCRVLVNRSLLREDTPGYGLMGVHATGNIINYGSISNNAGICRLFSAGGDVSNHGIINGGTVQIVGQNVGNGEIASIESTGNAIFSGEGVQIIASNLFYNQGLLISYDSPGGFSGNNVRVDAGRLNNTGTISAGNGRDGGRGGDLYVHTTDPNSVNNGLINAGSSIYDGARGGNVNISGQGFRNELSVQGGSGDGGGWIIVVQGSNEVVHQGTVTAGIGLIMNGNLSIYSQVAELQGRLRAGIRTEKSPMDPTYGNITIIGDSLAIHPGDSSIGGDTIVIMGNKVIIYDIFGAANFFANNLIQIYTSPDGYIDLSGTHTIGSLFSLGTIELYSDSILTPLEGLDFICNPDPIVNPADTSILGGSIFTEDEEDTSGHLDTLVIYIQNHSTLAQTFDYSITSIRGWVTPVSGTTPLLEPFAFFRVVEDYEIPDGSIRWEKDTVITVIESAPDFAESTISYITSAGSFSSRDTFTFELYEGWNILSFPFFDTHLMAESFPMILGDAWAYVDPDSGYAPIPSAWAGTGFWVLSPSDTTIDATGLYEADTIYYNFDPGWHMIGGPADTILATAITDLELVWDDIFGYDPILRRYIIVDFLLPGFSYWVFIEDTVEFSLP